MHEENVGSDSRALTDHGFAAENRRIRMDGDVIFDVGVAFSSFNDFAGGVARKAAGAKRHAMVKLNPIADDTGFAYDDASAVVNEEMGTDLGTGVDVNPGAGVRPFRHNSRQQRDIQLVKHMSHPLDGYGFDGGVSEDDFLEVFRGGIAFVSGDDVGAEKIANPRQIH